MEVAGILDNKIKLRKKFLYILLLAVLAVFFSLLIKRFENLSTTVSVNGRESVLNRTVESRGYPFPIVPMSDLGLLELARTPMIIVGFLSNLVFYFVVFSTIYFAYSSYFKKAKKK